MASALTRRSSFPLRSNFYIEVFSRRYWADVEAKSAGAVIPEDDMPINASGPDVHKQE